MRFIEVTAKQDYLALTLNRPEKLNALTLDMYQDLVECLDQATSQEQVKFVVIESSSEHFCAGNDLAAFADSTQDLTPVIKFLHAFHQFSKPVVAVVQGQAVGIGTTLLMHCDYVLASDTARFQLPFSQLGLCPEFAASYLLPKIVGKAKASEWLLLGEAFDAQAASEAGLINQVVKSSDLESTLSQLTKRLSRLPLQSLLATKRWLNAHDSKVISETIDLEAADFARLLRTEVTQNIIENFFKVKKHA